MKTSEQVNEIFAALSAAQGEIVDAFRGKQGYGYRYADLADSLKIIRPIFSKHGLAVVQELYNGTVDPTLLAGKSVGCYTRIGHASGQWIEFGPLYLPDEERKGMSQAQQIGATATYGRRYALQAACALASDDNDAAGEPVESAISQEQLASLTKALSLTKSDVVKFMKVFQIDDLSTLTAKQYERAMQMLNRKADHAAH